MNSPEVPNQKPPITLNLLNREKITFIHVPTGEFTFQPNDKDLKTTCKMSEFYLQETLMTQGQYMALIGHNPSTHKGRNLPVTNLSWLDIYKIDLFEKMQRKLKHQHQQDWTCRLPNEVEWEYAASFGNTRYAGSEHPMPVAWFKENSNGHTKPVASRLPNPLGLYDLSGNVWEFCHNSYTKQLNETRPYRLTANIFDWIAIRGGSSWHGKDYILARLRADERIEEDGLGLGLRLYLSPKVKQ